MHDDFSAAAWEERYRGRDPHAGAGPSPHLVAEARGLTPGSALDVGCGEGADARWLAAQGWRVTATDVSATALDRARARDEGGAVAWVRADLASGEWPGTARYDLVTAHYVHPATSREDFVARLAAAVAPGGTLLVVGHHPDDPHSAHADGPQVHYTPEDLVALLDPDRWDVVAAETRTRSVPGHGGTATTQDSVLRARRRA